jgi:hypothetical protein
MTAAVKELLNSFDRLSEPEKRSVCVAILRSTDSGSLTDEELVTAAEEIFLQYDREEAADESAQSG